MSNYKTTTQNKIHQTQVLMDSGMCITGSAGAFFSTAVGLNPHFEKSKNIKQTRFGGIGCTGRVKEKNLNRCRTEKEEKGCRSQQW